MNRFREDRQKKLAAIEAASSHSDDMQTGSQYDLMLKALSVHLNELKNIQSQERKIAHKQNIIAEYDAYIDGLLSAETSAQNDVLIRIMIWRIDIGDIEKATELALFALANDMTLPFGFKRDINTYIVEEIANSLMQKGNILVEDVSLLNTINEATSEADMPDEVRAKLYKALGIGQQELQPEIALQNLQRAHELNNNAGVKTLIKSLEKNLKTS